MKTTNQELRHRLLVLRAQSGGREAIDQLLRSIQVPLYGYILGLLNDPALAEDALQDVFVLICRNVRHLREPRFFRAWAYRIASRLALRMAARKRKRSGLSLEDPGLETAALAAPMPEPLPYDEDLVAVLPTLLSDLPPASRAVLSLHYFEEMSLQETADILEIPVGTAKSRLSYGLASIRRLIEKIQTEQESTKEDSK